MSLVDLFRKENRKQTFGFVKERIKYLFRGFSPKAATRGLITYLLLNTPPAIIAQEIPNQQKEYPPRVQLDFSTFPNEILDEIDEMQLQKDLNHAYFAMKDLTGRESPFLKDGKIEIKVNEEMGVGGSAGNPILINPICIHSEQINEGNPGWVFLHELGHDFTLGNENIEYLHWHGACEMWANFMAFYTYEKRLFSNETLEYKRDFWDNRPDDPNADFLHENTFMKFVLKLKDKYGLEFMKTFFRKYQESPKLKGETGTFKERLAVKRLAESISETTKNKRDYYYVINYLTSKGFPEIVGDVVEDESGDWERDIAYLEKLKELYPETRWIYDDLSQIYRKKNDLENLIKIYDEREIHLGEKENKDYNLFLDLTKICYEKKELKKSREYFKKAKFLFDKEEFNPDYIWTYVNFSKMSYDLGLIKDSIKFIDQALKTERLTEEKIYCIRGELNYLEGNLDETIKDYKNAIDSTLFDDEYGWATYRLGELNFYRGNLTKAINNFEEVLDMSETDKSRFIYSFLTDENYPSIVAEEIVKEGMFEINKECSGMENIIQNKKIAEWITKKSYEKLIELYFYEENLDKSFENYKKWTSYDETPEISFPLADKLFKRGYDIFEQWRDYKEGNIDDAISDIEKAIEIEGDKTYYHALADIYYQKGEVDKTISIYEKVLTYIDQDDSWSLEHLKELQDKLD